MAARILAFKSILGKRLGLGGYGQLVSNGLDISGKAVDATITISAEAATTADTRDITIVLKDAYGKPIDYAEDFEIRMYSTAAMTDFVAAGGSTGVVAGSNGKLLAIVAKKRFACITDVTGTWTGTYLDTATAAGYLGVVLQGGRKIGGGLVTNA